MIKTWTVVAVDNQSLPPLQVRAASEKVALKRAAEAIVRWHCERKALPYYHADYNRAKIVVYERGYAHERADLGGYQAYRYIKAWEPDAENGWRRNYPGHFRLCGGVFRLKESI